MNRDLMMTPITRPGLRASRGWHALLVVLALAIGAPLAVAEDTDFHRDIEPLLERYCYECHGLEPINNALTLTTLEDENDFKADHRMLNHLYDMVDFEEMPPMDHEVQPSREERAQLVAWAQGLLAELANARPDDPGVVVLPRINHREYDLVVRDLTGHELEIGQYLTEDSLAGAGFYNVGHAQSMTVGQFEAFLLAAKRVVVHARATPSTGISWYGRPQDPAPTPEDLAKVLTEAYVDRYNGPLLGGIKDHQRELQRSVDMVVGAYFEAAWRYHHREALGLGDASFEDIADAYEVPLYPGALRKVYVLVTGEADAVPGFALDGESWESGLGLLDNPYWQGIAERWRALPAPAAGDEEAVRDRCRELDRRVEHYRGAEFTHRPTAIENRGHSRYNGSEIRGMTHRGHQPLEVHLDQADGHFYLVVGSGGDGAEGDFAVWGDGEIDGRPWHEVLGQPRAVIGEPASFDGEGRLAVQAPSVLEFAVPAGAERLFVQLHLDEQRGGNASVQGMVTDEAPDLATVEDLLHRRRILGTDVSDAAKRLANQTGDVANLTTDNSGYCKMRDRHAFADLDPEVVARLPVPEQSDPRRLNAIFALSPSDVRHRADEEWLAGLELRDRQLRDMAFPPSADEATAAAEVALAALAARAWRRPVEADELDGLMAFYHEQTDAGASFDAAIKVPMIAILISSEFLYRFQETRASAEPYPLVDADLAERLAFSLWGSLPDETLLELAAAGRLQDEEVLREQVGRMLEDERAVGLAREFAAQWLGYTSFERDAAPDAERFEDYYEDDLERAMAQEIEFFFVDLFANDRPVTNVLDSDYTFLNGDLAKHYGIDGVRGDHMRRVELEGDRRGGVIGMGAIHTMLSNPLRTSPVKRGAWVYERLLGYHLPAPPANVGQISDDERNEEGLTIRQQLEQHRDNPACFGCHDRIDPLGVAMEKFDAIGAWRDQDLAGDPIDDQGTFVSDARTLDGLTGLREYLQEHRDHFVHSFCEKLLAYCLGRDIEPTDAPLVARMEQALIANDFRPRAAIETVVLSQQFRFRRDDPDHLSMKD